MKRVLQITVCLVVLLAVMSAYPGLIASTILSFEGFLFLLPLLGLWFLFVGCVALRELVQRRPLRSAFGLQAAVFSGFVFGLVVLRIPLRLGFAVSRPAFERFLRTTAVPEERQAASNWFGIYRADHAKDTRGGTFFRTGTGADFIDTMSYGFAFQPNPKGTPFGAAGYSVSRLSGDWHTFYVSDDYH